MPKERYKGLNNKQKFEHNHKTVFKHNEYIFVKKKSDSASQNLPFYSEPGDKYYILLDKNNEIYQIRVFNDITGMPVKDIDVNQSHGKLIKGTHVHEYVNNNIQVGEGGVNARFGNTQDVS